MGDFVWARRYWFVAAYVLAAVLIVVLWGATAQPGVLTWAIRAFAVAGVGVFVWAAPRRAADERARRFAAGKSPERVGYIGPLSPQVLFWGTAVVTGTVLIAWELFA